MCYADEKEKNVIYLASSCLTACRYQQQVDTFLSQQFSMDQIAFTQDNIKNTIETVASLYFFRVTN